MTTRFLIEFVPESLRQAVNASTKRVLVPSINTRPLGAVSAACYCTSDKRGGTMPMNLLPALEAFERLGRETKQDRFSLNRGDCNEDCTQRSSVAAGQLAHARWHP